MSDPVLSIDGLTRRFGGLLALDDVSLICHYGQIHAVIGPNGAGKSTLINLLSGELSADSGHVIFDGIDVIGMPPHRLARMGIARSYQKTNIFLELTTLENCHFAAQSQISHVSDLLKLPENCKKMHEQALAALAASGLAAASDKPAGNLSHGEQRQLEIAMILALRPKVLMLDEPLAGMGADESSRMIELLRLLKKEHAILLIEHDMDAVFALADVITVMQDGRVMASGSPVEIRANPEVQRAYLGLPVVHA